MHFLLLYDFAPDYLERRPAYRAQHLKLAWEAHSRGELILGGAAGEPPDSAVILFQGQDDRAARAFAAQDPYVAAGLVTAWRIKPWMTVVGEDAAAPVRPSAP